MEEHLYEMKMPVVTVGDLAISWHCSLTRVLELIYGLNCDLFSLEKINKYKSGKVTYLVTRLSILWDWKNNIIIVWDEHKNTLFKKSLSDISIAYKTAYNIGLKYHDFLVSISENLDDNLQIPKILNPEEIISNPNKSSEKQSIRAKDDNLFFKSYPIIGEMYELFSQGKTRGEIRAELQKRNRGTVMGLSKSKVERLKHKLGQQD